MYLFPVQAYFSYAKCFVFAISPKLSTGTDFSVLKIRQICQNVSFNSGCVLLMHRKVIIVLLNCKQIILCR